MELSAGLSGRDWVRGEMRASGGPCPGGNSLRGRVELLCWGRALSGWGFAEGRQVLCVPRVLR